MGTGGFNENIKGLTMNYLGKASDSLHWQIKSSSHLVAISLPRFLSHFALIMYCRDRSVVNSMRLARFSGRTPNFCACAWRMNKHTTTQMDRRALSSTLPCFGKLYIRSITNWQYARDETVPAIGQLCASSRDTWEFDVSVMENFIPASMVWDVITTKHD